jgi:hypothetical protein
VHTLVCRQSRRYEVDIDGEYLYQLRSLLSVAWTRNLPTGQQLHLTGVLVDVAVRATDGAINRCLFTGHGAVLAMC